MNSTPVSIFGSSARARRCASIEAAVDGGFYCVGGLKSDPWVTRLSGEPRYQAALERARAGRRETAAAFREAGGEELLGVVESGEPLP